MLTTVLQVPFWSSRWRFATFFRVCNKSQLHVGSDTMRECLRKGKICCLCSLMHKQWSAKTIIQSCNKLNLFLLQKKQTNKPYKIKGDIKEIYIITDKQCQLGGSCDFFFLLIPDSREIQELLERDDHMQWLDSNQGCSVYTRPLSQTLDPMAQIARPQGRLVVQWSEPCRCSRLP